MNISKDKKLLILLIVLFVCIRLFGVGLPYHQDEQKYVARGVLLQGTSTTSGHPPLLGIIMTMAGFLFSDKYFRLMPILFGTGSLVMFYFLMRNLFDSRTAFWAGFLYAISPYGVWSSLMVDVDGAVLPFFALSSFLFYDLWRKGERRYLYGVLCLVSLVLGALTKLSFVLVFAALGADLIIYFWRKGYRRAVYIIGGLALLSPLIVLLFVWLLASMIPTFDFKVTLGHARGYIGFSGRNYDQIVYQLFKAFLYLSPLLVIPAFFISLKNLIRLRVLVFYMFFALVFYLILFDFSSAALDKYLMVVVIPLSALSGVALAQMEWSHQSWRWLMAGLVVSGLIILDLALLPQAVPALYPKDEWLNRIFDLRWNFLVPFMGGSGPLGFYSSWFFLGLSWIIALAVGAFAFIRRSTISVRSFILVIGIAYCAIMLSDMLFGYPNGSSEKIYNDALLYIRDTRSVKSVITYNDDGAYYLNLMGKYERRMFVAPKYEEFYTDILNKYHGHILVIDIPRIHEDSVYWRYISSCKPEFVSRSGHISGTVYNCAKHIKL